MFHIFYVSDFRLSDVDKSFEGHIWRMVMFARKENTVYAKRAKLCLLGQWLKGFIHFTLLSFSLIHWNQSFCEGIVHKFCRY